MIKSHFMNNIILYAVIILSFAVGISTGAITVTALSQEQSTELCNYMKDFFSVLNTQNISNLDLFKTSIFDNIKNIILLWFLGITVIGIPFVLIMIGLKGFVTGFTVGFLIRYLGFKGVIFSLVGILPQSLIVVPCYIALGVICIAFSLTIFKNRSSKHRREDIKTSFLAYTTLILILLCLVSLGSVVEAYVTPVFIKSLAKIFI